MFFLCISTQQINFDLELEPVKLLGNVEVVRSLADKKKGPKFYVHAKRNPLEAEVNNYDIIIILLRYLPRPGGAMASLLVHSTPDQAVQVQAQAEVTMLCSRERWVPANLMLGITLRWTSIPSRGE